MRNRYLDLLRALAIARVVVYHATGWGVLTIVFPAMGLMFGLAGSLMAASLDRHGLTAIRGRLRRLLPPLWMMAAVFVPAMLLTGLRLDPKVLLWLFPITDPPANGWGSLVLSTIWYLREYLWFVLLSPLALVLFRRFPWPMVFAPLGLQVAIAFGMPAHTIVRDFAIYFGCWVLGFAHHDGLLERMRASVLVAVSLVLASGGAAWFLTHPGKRGYDLNDIPLAHAPWALAFVLLVLGFAPARAAWVDRPALLGRFVTFLNKRAVTVYLWHMPVVIALTLVLTPLGLWGTGDWTVGLQVALVVAVVAVPVAVFGWVEDVAARRRSIRLPVPRLRRPAGTRTLEDSYLLAGYDLPAEYRRARDSRRLAEEPAVATDRALLAMATAGRAI